MIAELKEPVRTISYSAISTYQLCPLRYKFRYVDRLPEETMSSSLAFGRSIHWSIQRWFEARMCGHQEPRTDQLLSEFWEEWRCCGEEKSIVLAKNESTTSVSELARRVLEAFVGSSASQVGGQILGIEERLQASIIEGIPEVVGVVDLIIDTDDGLLLIDWKTSKSRWSDLQVEQSASQLLLYSQLVQEVVDDRPVRPSFGVVTKTKSPTVELRPVSSDRKAMDRTNAMVQRTWRSIEQGNFYPCPSVVNCITCPYRRQCAAWPSV